MYNLQKPYTVISFEREEIKILVMDVTDKKEKLCLYYNSVKCQYLDENHQLINHSDLVRAVSKLLLLADEFIGLRTHRVIVSIPCLKISTSTMKSQTYNIFEPIKEKDIATYCENELNTKYADSYLLDVIPLTWHYDNRVSTDLPIGISCSKLSFTFTAIKCDKDFVNQFCDVVKTSSCSVMAVTCNVLSLGTLAIGNDENKQTIVIDMRDTNTFITAYGANAKILSSKDLNYGSNKFFSNICKKLGNVSTNQLVNVVNCFNVFKDDKQTLVNIFSDDFLNVIQANKGDLAKLMFNETVSYFNKIENEIRHLCGGNIKNIENIYINLDEPSRQAIFNNYSLKLFDDIQVKLITNSIIGLSNKYVNHIIGSLLYVVQQQEKNNKIVYSMDPFVSQKVENLNSRQNILVKMGLATTKWANKI